MKTRVFIGWGWEKIKDIDIVLYPERCLSPILQTEDVPTALAKDNYIAFCANLMHTHQRAIYIHHLPGGGNALSLAGVRWNDFFPFVR